MDDGNDRADGERKFVAERDIDQDAEHREDRSDDGGLLNFLADARADALRTARTLAGRRTRQRPSFRDAVFPRDG